MVESPKEILKIKSHKLSNSCKLYHKFELDVNFKCLIVDMAKWVIWFPMKTHNIVNES